MDEAIRSPQDILKLMLERDEFSRWLGLEIDEYAKGYCRLHYRITETMINGLQTVHGGILFSAADSALAFSCNSLGILSVALDASISFTRPARLGDLLTVEAKELHLG